MAVSEHQVLGLLLTGGQAGDAPVGEERLAEVLAKEEIKAVGADRAYDSDAIRALIAAAGKEAVIPPRANRVDPPDYDKEKDKERNKAERLFSASSRATGAWRRATTSSPPCSWVARSPPCSPSA